MDFAPSRTAATGGTRPAAPLTIELRSATERGPVMALWQALEQSLAPVAISCSYVWVDTWLRHFGNLIPHQFVIARRGVAVRAVLLLTRNLEDRQSWLPLSTWQFGTAGELESDSVCIEYNDWLCVPEEKDHLLHALLTSADSRLACDRWRFDGFAAVDLPDPVGSAAEWLRDQRASRYLDLRAIRESGRELITFFGDSTRKHIRQNLRDYGTVTFEWTETVDAAHAAFDQQIELHQARWNSVGQPGCYSSAQFTAFHRDLIDRMVPAGLMTIVRASAHGQTLGCSQLLFDRNRVLVYQGGRVANSGKSSPGVITDYESMRECLRRGYDAFDFMAGDTQHKQRMTTHTAPLVWAEYRRPNWKWTVLDAVRNGKHTLRQWIHPRAAERQTPASAKKD